MTAETTTPRFGTRGYAYELLRMNLLATGDLHVTPRGYFSRTQDEDGETALSKMFLATAAWVRGLAGSDTVLLLNGDTTTTPGYLDAETLHLLGQLEQVWGDLPRIANIGNHDMAAHTGLHNLSLHTRISGYSIPSCNSVLHHSSGLYVVPFTYSLDDQIKLIRTIPDGSIVAIHTPIQGAYLNPAVNDDNGVSSDEFRRFSLTLAGHYHTPQYLHAGSRTMFNAGMGGNFFCPSTGSILILGTPLPHSFADAGEAYGVWEVDLVSKSVVFRLNPHAPRYLNVTIGSLAELEQHRYDTSGCPVYVSLTAPQNLHKEILSVGLPGVTAFRLRRPLVEAPRRDQVVVPPPLEGDRKGDLVATLLSYLDSLGQSYDRAAVEKSVVGELSLSTIHDRDGNLGGRVKFIQMKIDNFLSYERAEIEFGAPGLWLVSGINLDTETGEGNGAGKSSLIEALIWCLYGDLLREYPSKESLVRKGEDGCKVEVEFEANGETYRVVRTRYKPSSKTVVTLLLLAKGHWVNIAAGSVTESNKQIASTIGITQDDFILTSIFAPYMNSSFANIKDGDKKQFLSRVYELGVFDEISEKYREMLQTSSRSISSREGSLLAQEEQISKTREMYESKKISAESEAQMRKGQISSAEMLLASASSSRDLITAEEHAKKHLLATQEEYLQKKRETEVRLEGVRSRLQRSEQRILVTRATLLSSPSSCASCGQPLTEEAKQEYARGLEGALDKEIREHALTLGEKDALENQLVPTTTASVAQITSLKAIVGDLEEARRSLSDSISSLKEKINLLRSLPDPAEGVRELEEALAASSRTIKDARSELEKLRAEKDLFALLVSALGPRGVVSYVLDRAIVQLNSYLEHVSRTLYGKDYSVWLASTKELKDGRDANIITLQYSTPGGSFGLSSGGEKGKARIALFMAINYLLTAQGRGTTNLIMLDEALDSLDAKAASSTVESLRRFVDEEGKTCFLISHSEGVKSLIDRQIIVERCNEISRIIHNGSIRDSHPQRV